MTRKEYLEQWRKLNKQHLSEWYQKNKEKRKMQMSAWRKKNAVAILAKNREYKKENNASQQLYKLRNAEKTKVLSALKKLETALKKYFEL
jgi:ABC-type antimicrobial peptide transport system ATPase subunit